MLAYLICTCHRAPTMFAKQTAIKQIHQSIRLPIWFDAKNAPLSLPMYLIYDTFIMLCASSRSFCPIWQENTETPMIVVVFAMQSHSAEDVRRTTATNVVEHNKKGNISLALYFNKYRHSRSINLGWQTLIGNSNTANELNNRRCAFVWFFISLSFCSFFFCHRRCFLLYKQ